MPIKFYNPTSAGRRAGSVLDYKAVLTKFEPEKSLTDGKRRHNGSNKPPKEVTEAIQEMLDKVPGSGCLLIGDKGQLFSDYNTHALLPEKDWTGFKPPAPFIPNSIGHHKEWIEACKNETMTTCNFDYSGALTEAALLGNVAFRAGKKLEWNSKKLKATHCPEADQYIHHHYRKGWKLG